MTLVSFGFGFGFCEKTAATLRLELRPKPKTSAEVIEHREDNWSRKRLLLDVGATDANDTATGL